MTNEKILEKLFGTTLTKPDRKSLLKAMAEAVAISEAKMIHEYGKTNEAFRAELAAKDKEIAELKKEILGFADYTWKPMGGLGNKELIYSEYKNYKP